MNKLKELSKKKWFIVLIIIIAIALVGGFGTYAMLYWRSAENTEITLKIGDIADVIFPQGQELNTNNLTPVFNYTDGEQLTFSIKNKDTSGAYISYTVNFNITNIDDELKSTSLRYKLMSGDTVVGQGSFKNASSNSTMRLAKGKLPSGTSNYTLYIYIDSNEENDPNMMNKNLRGVVEVTAVESVAENFVEYITNLYRDNKDADPVINNNIEYGYASSVNLMNDRLGGITESLDGGNIRFYGAEETYLENSTGADGQREVGNWETLFAKYGMTPTFSDSEGCETWVTNNGGWNENTASETGYATLAEFCSTSQKYYKSLKNYIDIGDKTEVTTEKGNWEKIAGNIGVSTEQECLDLIEKEGIDDTQMQQYYGVTVSQFCSVTTIPAGTPMLWRIIGVFDGKLRIRRDENIDGYSFDTSASGVNGGSGINEWSQADLMKLLNPGYQDLEVGGSLWYNSQSGTCYNGTYNGTTSCDFTNTGLSDEAKEFIVDQTIYLGGFDTLTKFADQAYVEERKSNVIQNPDDGIPRTTSWTGKVALIYPSDFGYAADLSNANCQDNLSRFNNCTANWMKGTSWTVSPLSVYDNNEVYVSGTLGKTFTYTVYGGWPVLTLNGSVTKVSGTGSKDDPYVIG